MIDSIYRKLGFSDAFIAEIENAKRNSDQDFTLDSYHVINDYSSDCQDGENLVIKESDQQLSFDSFVL